MSRLRKYVIFATARGGRFSQRMSDYGSGSHRWIYRVWAGSLREAWSLAAREVWAADARSAGVRSIERDWWHTRHTPESAIAAGLVVVAPWMDAMEVALTPGL
jgi:hypothetical protein